MVSDQDRHQEHIVPVCVDAECTDSRVYIYSHGKVSSLQTLIDGSMADLAVQLSLRFKTPPFNNSLHFKTSYQWHHSFIFNPNILEF